jgi:Peptidase family M1 domain
MKKIYPWLYIIVLIGTFSFAFASQVITGEVKIDKNLYYTHSIEFDAGKYKKLNVDNSPYGVFQVQPTFIESTSHKVKPKKGYVEVQLQKNTVNTINLSLKVKPVVDTPVFQTYDLAPFIGSFLGESNPVSVKYPESFQYIGGVPTIPTDAQSEVKLNYPDNDYLGVISLSFIPDALPPNYFKETYGMYTIIGTRYEIDSVKEAVKDLGFLPSFFQEITGQVPQPRLYIVTGRLSNRGILYTNMGGILRRPNILILDKENFDETTSYIPSLTKLIIHETAHAEFVPLVYGGENFAGAWLDEGLAVFAANYVADHYLDEGDYFIDYDEDGNAQVYQDLNDRYTPKSLSALYKRKFMYDVPNDETWLTDFYAHAGLVIYSFYKDVGSKGMREFIQGVSALRSTDGSCSKCEAKKILAIMSKISGKSTDQLLYPYKGSKQLFKDLAPIIKNDYTEEEVWNILEEYEGQ